MSKSQNNSDTLSDAIASPRLLFTPDTKFTAQQTGSTAFVHFLPFWSYGELVSAFWVSLKNNRRKKIPNLNFEILGFIIGFEILVFIIGLISF